MIFKNPLFAYLFHDENLFMDIESWKKALVLRNVMQKLDRVL